MKFIDLLNILDSDVEVHVYQFAKVKIKESYVWQKIIEGTDTVKVIKSTYDDCTQEEVELVDIIDNTLEIKLKYKEVNKYEIY